MEGHGLSLVAAAQGPVADLGALGATAVESWTGHRSGLVAHQPAPDGSPAPSASTDAATAAIWADETGDTLEASHSAAHGSLGRSRARVHRD